MTKPANLESIEEKTGKKWTEWVALLDSVGARELKHIEITNKLHEITDLDGWWIQNVTVAYEQHIGRRVPGQREDGTFEVSVSKTLTGLLDDVYAKWLEITDQATEFNGTKLTGDSSTSETEKWRNWRVNLADGTKVIVGINQKDDHKALLGLAHQKITDQQTAERWREYWKGYLQNLN